MTTLSRKERRVLRRREHSLHEDDPHWVNSFGKASVTSFQVLLARVCLACLLLATVLILAALALDDSQMVIGGITVLAILPLAILVLMLADKYEQL
jgi:hypothetical protein